MKKPVLDKKLEVKIEGAQTVTNNIKEIKEQAIAIRDYYLNLVYSEDQIKEATSERAKLNKVAKNIDDNRKLIVAQYNRPLDEFVSLAKETVSIIKEASGSIDLQVKKYENGVKEEKKKDCEELFDNEIGELKDLISFDKIFNPKWLNKTTKMSEIETDIKQTIEKANAGIKAIKQLNSDYETEVINTFLIDFDLSKAIMKNDELKKQKETLEKTQEIKQKKAKEMSTEPIKQEQEENPIETYTLKLKGRHSAMVALRRFMDLNDILFEKVE